MTTNVDITNRALAEIGTRSQITSMTDGSQEAIYANLLYNGFRDFILRNGEYEFALKSAPVTATTAPTPPWSFGYVYPLDCVRVREVIPTGVNMLDPYPAEFTVGNLVAGTGRIVATNIAVSNILFISNEPTEDNWDSMFTEAMVRFLGSGLMFALENGGAPSQRMLNEAMEFAAAASGRDG